MGWLVGAAHGTRTIDHNGVLSTCYAEAVLLPDGGYSIVGTHERSSYVQYRIRVNGHLDESWQAWFAPLQISREATGTTVLSGSLPDQSALYGVLLKLDRLGLTLLAVERRDAQHDADSGHD